MSAQMYLTPQNQPGRLWIMPCPDGARLSTDIAQYRAAGVDHLISMQPVDEAVQLGLAQEAAECATAGIQFHRHPIVDFGLPEIDSFNLLTHQIAGWLALGEGVGVHCRAGIGRSGMVVAGALIFLGQSVSEAVHNVSNARSVSIPDTVEQATFLALFENYLSEK